MSSNAKNWTVILLTGGATALFAWLVLNRFDHDVDSVRTLLRLTARIAFFVYLIVFIARPLRQLFKTDTTKWLLKERRSFGLAFGAIMIVHLALIFYRAEIDPEFSVQPLESIPGMIAYSLLLLMMITSFNSTARALGPRRWRILHKTGLYWFGILFLATLLPADRSLLFAPGQVGLYALAAAAVFIRLTAYFAAQKKKNG
ncbi:MAG: ferric reductase-like transmembrane domain-containing protein [Woeseiaceae bacterium]|nr:ferric reductase-like transmembrane domain-containing protein [Woeseiaceae bacterium]